MDYTAPREVTIRQVTRRTTRSGHDYEIVHESVRIIDPPLTRFMAKVDKDGPGGCWLWTGYTEPATGYAKWRMPEDKHSTPAHRAAYRMLVGPIPKGKYLDHLCRVRHCVNPDHLEPVTPQTNVDRGLGAKKDECGKGHALSGENLGVRSDGRRYCKACSRLRSAKYFGKV
jgi:hypothetical protein